MGWHARAEPGRLTTARGDTSVTIRSETPADAPAIAALVRLAYADVPHSDHREHLMIERLRAVAAYRPELSLLAEVNDVPVGHILLTCVGIRGERSSVPSLALAPLSVVPLWQSRGIGRALVLASHERAARLGFGSIVLIGMPGFYARFGYEPLGDHPITVPFAVPKRNCMIAALRPGALAGVEGIVDYPREWMQH